MNVIKQAKTTINAAIINFLESLTPLLSLVFILFFLKSAPHS